MATWHNDWTVSEDGLTLTHKTGVKALFGKVLEVFTGPVAYRYWDKITLKGLAELKRDSDVGLLVDQSVRLYQALDKENRYIEPKEVLEFDENASRDRTTNR